VFQKIIVRRLEGGRSSKKKIGGSYHEGPLEGESISKGTGEVQNRGGHRCQWKQGSKNPARGALRSKTGTKAELPSGKGGS